MPMKGLILAYNFYNERAEISKMFGTKPLCKRMGSLK